ncbi:MAG: hypothetical protein JXK05_14470 [Campylobacterales bacterium]|nr:hypothetical protein [Campylobacterales bacterium]
MKFALPLDARCSLYMHNPCTAPQFGIYAAHEQEGCILYSRLFVAPNPWQGGDCSLKADESSCPAELRGDTAHFVEHYGVLEAISGCRYLLVSSACENTKRAMRHAGIKLFGIPPFCNTIDKAIRHFLIGAKIAARPDMIVAAL